MRLYDPDHEVLAALQGSNIELILDVPNSYLARIYYFQSQADTWVSNYVRNYTKGIKFRYISVGNEVQPFDTVYVSELVKQRIENENDKLMILRITLGTKCDISPPGNARNRESCFRPRNQGLHNYRHQRNKSPLLVNIDTYFSYVKSRGEIINDGFYSYQNLFLALLDSVYAALEKTGGRSLEIVVSESGWPTAGGTAANVDNARTYVNHLMQTVKNGSPRRPGRAIETYLLLDFDISFPNNC
ncbi:hypothetical protein IGI04_031011 [Brassica rapa subsp. trilocularis]|uniref:glucan endo-1,3-beta-D-glucosidase n=1 Tax=Brassica rapa subsp. trilocularis TaxID=1813537 RepID=A0ABQ7LV43_BRACM|nr:hypothetical protein IGI04_031011 [Brassica rapa subsp. trilocularis]